MVKKKRKIGIREIKKIYKRTGSMKKTSLKLNLSYKQVKEATLEQRLTKKDKFYRDILVDYDHFKNRKEAVNYIFRVKNLHRREKRIYGRPVTQWIDPYEGVERWV